VPDTQELIALGIVAVVVGWAIYRRIRRKAGGCADCAGKPAANTGETTVRFYKRAPPGDDRRGNDS
jgi:hypothetical protein